MAVGGSLTQSHNFDCVMTIVVCFFTVLYERKCQLVELQFSCSFLADRQPFGAQAYVACWVCRAKQHVHARTLACARAHATWGALVHVHGSGASFRTHGIPESSPAGARLRRCWQVRALAYVFAHNLLTE